MNLTRGARRSAQQTEARAAGGGARRPAAAPAWVLVSVYLVLLLLIPSGQVLGPLGAAGTPASVFGMGLLFWWLCARLAGQVIGSRTTPVHLAVAGLVIAVLLAWANGVAFGWVRPADVREITDAVWTLLPVTPEELHAKSTLAGFRGLIAVSSWVGVTLVVCDGLRSWRELDKVMTLLVWLGAVVGLIGVVQFLTGTNLAESIRVPGLSENTEMGSSERSGFTRVQATAIHPIEFGVVLGALLPLALHHSLERARTWVSHVPAAVLVVAVPLSVSRSGILVLATSMLVMVFGWSWNRRAWFLVATPVVLVAMRTVFPGLVGTIRSLFTSVLVDPSVSGRTSDYGVVLGIYGEHPWFGRGQSTFMPSFYRTLDNQLMMTLLELGAVGLLACLWLIGAAVYCARWVKRCGPTPERRHLGLTLSASVLGIFLSYLTFDAWSFSMAAGTSFLLIGLCGSVWRLSRNDHEAARAARAAWPARPAGTAATARTGAQA